MKQLWIGVGVLVGCAAQKPALPDAEYALLAQRWVSA